MLTKGLGYLHRAPSLAARASSAWRARRVPWSFEPTVHPPFARLFRRFGPLDQGELNACTGFGVAMGATLQAAASGAPRTQVLAPRLPYWAARRREAGRDDRVRDIGAYVEDVVWAFNAFGATEVAPGSGLLSLTAETVNERPPLGMFRAALRVRSQLRLRMRAIVDGGDRLLQRLAHSLHQGQVGFVALPVADSFLEPGPDAIPEQPMDDAIGYHFVCVLDWRRPPGGDYELLCGNSWGPHWGEGGTAWMSPALVRQSLGAWFLEVEQTARASAAPPPLGPVGWGSA